MSRLSIEIDAEQHRQIKTLATFEGMSMKDYILSKVLSTSDPAETKDDTKVLIQMKLAEKVMQENRRMLAKLAK